jgi:hypothetical protein
VFVLWLWTAESEAPDDMWQLMHPFASLLAVFIIKSLLKAVDYQAVRPFDLSIGRWVCDRDIFNFDASVLAELPELVGREI